MRKRFVALLTGSVAATVGLATVGMTAMADQVILDDLIVDGSACIGFDCVNGESFGFDTLRLKENNLRIKFEDTSSSASFPSNDWQLTANDTSNGGANKFSIDDITGGRTPFTVEAGAPSHSLFVEDGGRLGLGTNTPVVDIHTKKGNTPTLRLEQDGTSGFATQTFDIAGNEANFFVRDATNGSTLPFRIQPGAPTNALSIESTGDVGLGVQSPTADLHVRATEPEAAGAANEGLIRIENANSATQSVRFYLENSDSEFFFQVDPQGRFKISDNDQTFAAFQIDDDTGEITMRGDVNIVGTLTCNGVAC